MRGQSKTSAHLAVHPNDANQVCNTSQGCMCDVSVGQMHVQRPGWGIAVCGSCNALRLRCYKETQELGMHRQSETRAENHEGTHAQETPAYQRRPATLHGGQGSNPPIRALYMQPAKIVSFSMLCPSTLALRCLDVISGTEGLPCCRICGRCLGGAGCGVMCVWCPG